MNKTPYELALFEKQKNEATSLIKERLVKRAERYWLDFGLPLPARIITQRFSRKLHKFKIDLLDLLDDLQDAGLIIHIQSLRGGTYVFTSESFQKLDSAAIKHFQRNASLSLDALLKSQQEIREALNYKPPEYSELALAKRYGLVPADATELPDSVSPEEAEQIEAEEARKLKRHGFIGTGFDAKAIDSIDVSKKTHPPTPEPEPAKGTVGTESNPFVLEE